MNLKTLLNQLRLRRDSFSKVAMLWGNSYLGQIISFAFVVLLIRDLGLQGFGSYAIGMAIVTLGALATDCGVGGLFSSYVSTQLKARDAAKYELRAIRVVTASAAILVGLVLFIAFSLPALFIFALVVGVISVFEDSWLLQAEGQVRHYVTGDLLTRTVTFLAWILLSRFENSPAAAIAAVGFGFIARSIYTGQKTKTRGKLLSCPKNIGSIIRSAAPISISKFLYTTTNQLTPLLFGLTSPIANVGIFASADKPIRALQAGANSYAVFALPKIAQHRDTKHFVPSIVRHLISVASLSTGLALVIFLAAPAISWLLIGSSDEVLISCIRIMALIPVFGSINNLVTVAITPTIGRTSINLYASLVGAAVLGLMFVFFQRPFSPQSMALGVALVEFAITASSVILTFMLLAKNRGERKHKWQE
jgi:O-antigen/teichoic acid export membrane protein